MEFLWMFPLYILIPIAGVIILYKGVTSGKGFGRKRIFFGCLLLSLPLLHGLLIQRLEARNEKSLIGQYVLDSTKQKVLKLNADKTFTLVKLDSLQSFGNGEWEYFRWDIDEVNLTFSDSSKLSFHIVDEEETKYLQNNFWTGFNHKYVKLVKSTD